MFVGEDKLAMAAMIGMLASMQGPIPLVAAREKEVRDYRDRPVTNNQSNEVKRRLRQERKRQLKMEKNNVG